ncbi:MAG TPA: hypothetical protein VII94_03605 [Candidatus Saccharimonadales bacterium]
MFGALQFLAFSDTCSILAVVGTILGMSAHPQSTYRIEIDKAFSEEDITPMLQAIAEWEEISDGNIIFDVDYEACEVAPYTVCIKKVSSSYLNGLVKYDNLGSAGETVYNNIPGSSSILMAGWKESGFTKQQLKGITAHELGHAMMLTHSKKGVMYYSLGGAGTLDVNCDDLAQFSFIYKLPNQSLSCPKGGHWEDDDIHNK